MTLYIPKDERVYMAHKSVGLNGRKEKKETTIDWESGKRLREERILKIGGFRVPKQVRDIQQTKIVMGDS